MPSKQKKHNQMLYGVIASFVGGLLAVTYFLNKETLYDSIVIPEDTELSFETQSFINADQIRIEEADVYIVFEPEASEDIIEEVLAEMMQDSMIAPAGYYQPYKDLGDLGGHDWEKVYVLEQVNIGMLARKYMRNPYLKYVEPKDIFVLTQNTSLSGASKREFEKSNIDASNSRVTFDSAKQKTDVDVLSLGNDQPDDFYYGEQWYLHQYGYGYQDSLSCEPQYKRVYVIDNGFTSHEDINYATQAYDIADKDNNAEPADITSKRVHGLRMAGLIASKTNNGIGIASVGNTEVYAIKATRDNSENPELLTHACEGLARAYKEAQNNGEDKRMALVPASSRRISRTCKKLIDTLTQEGMTLIAAAGNDDKQYKKYPAALPKVVAVAASNQLVKKADFSNYGDYIYYTAPGEAVMTTSLDNGYEKMDGTSASAALVAARMAAGYQKTVSMPDDGYYTRGKMGQGLIAYESCDGNSPISPNPDQNPEPDTILGKIMKTSDTQKAGPGERVEYSIMYVNTSQEIQDLKLVDELPDYMKLIDTSRDPDDLSNGNLVRYLNQLQPNEEITIDFTVEILENLAPLNNGEMIINCVIASTIEEPSCWTLPYVRSGVIEPNP